MLHAIDPEKHGPFGAPMAQAVQSCVHCGFCLAACPTYQELKQEMDTPRGRIVLMKQVLEGTLQPAEAQLHIGSRDAEPRGDEDTSAEARRSRPGLLGRLRARLLSRLGGDLDP